MRIKRPSGTSEILTTMNMRPQLEVYYKNMQNLIDYANGADLQLNPNVEALLRYGKGWSYGAEMLIRKKYGRFSGWIAYTLARTRQQFPGINNGAAIPRNARPAK